MTCRMIHGDPFNGNKTTRKHFHNNFMSKDHVQHHGSRQGPYIILDVVSIDNHKYYYDDYLY